eukprot:scaffold62983_cov33-Phaeocystis_antarctica.AAC.1
MYTFAATCGATVCTHARGWYACGVRTVLSAPGASCHVPLIRKARRRLVRVARTYSTEAPERTLSA